VKIVVVSPHPDDESLGAGGLIIKNKKAGNQVFWINMTDVGKNQGWDDQFIVNRKKQIEKICSYYDFDGFYNLKYPPTLLGSIDIKDIIMKFGKCISEIEPDWLVLPNPGDAHSDHRITYEVGMSCAKVFRYPSIKKVMTMEILSETDFSKSGESFSPNYFVDISEQIEEKLDAVRIYDTELGEPPFPRSIEALRALAVIRGSASGCRYAEAFRIIKEIDR